MITAGRPHFVPRKLPFLHFTEAGEGEQGLHAELHVVGKESITPLRADRRAAHLRQDFRRTPPSPIPAA